MTRTLLLSAYLGLALSTAIPAWGNVRAQAGALLRLSPSDLHIAEGETATVEVRVEGADGLYGLDVRLSFDPSVAEVVDADPSTGGIQVRPGDLLSLDFVVRNEADNDQGTIWFALTQLNPSEAVSGDGVAFTIALRGKGAGSSGPLSITFAQLAERGGETIPVSTEDSMIQVVENGDGAPEPTTSTSAQVATQTPSTETIQPPAPQPTLITPAPTLVGTPIAAESTSPASTRGSGNSTPQSTPTPRVVESPASPTAAATVIAPELSPSPAPSGSRVASPRSTAATIAKGGTPKAGATAPGSPSASQNPGSSGRSTGFMLAIGVGALGAILLLVGIAGILRLARRKTP